MTATEMRSTEMPAIRDATKRLTPSGGVQQATLLVTTRTMPKWIGSMPSWRIHGQEHRYEDDDGRQRFHEHAEDVQHADDHEQHEMGIVGNAEHDGRKALRASSKVRILPNRVDAPTMSSTGAAGPRAFQQGR